MTVKFLHLVVLRFLSVLFLDMCQSLSYFKVCFSQFLEQLTHSENTHFHLMRLVLVFEVDFEKVLYPNFFPVMIKKLLNVRGGVDDIFYFSFHGVFCLTLGHL